MLHNGAYRHSLLQTSQILSTGTFFAKVSQAVSAAHFARDEVGHFQQRDEINHPVVGRVGRFCQPRARVQAQWAIRDAIIRWLYPHGAPALSPGDLRHAGIEGRGRLPEALGRRAVAQDGPDCVGRGEDRRLRCVGMGRVGHVLECRFGPTLTAASDLTRNLIGWCPPP